MTRIYLATLAMTLLVCLGGCGRQKLTPDEVERNRLFAEILLRADQRALGDDDFFLTNLSNGGDPQVQQWCAIALGRIGSPRALPLLYQACHSPLAALRAAAAFAIGEIADRDLLEAQFVPAVPAAWIELRAMLYDSSPVVQMRAIEALGKCAPEAEAVAIIDKVQNLRYSGTPLERAWLDLSMTALVRLRNPAAIPVLEDLAAIGEPEIQWRAVDALTRLNATEACPLFQRLIKSHHADSRAYAARGLGICRGNDLVDMLTPLLPPRDAVSGREVPLRVRVSALQALGSLGDPAAIPAIVEALRSEAVDHAHPDQLNFAVQAAAVLEKMGDRLSKDSADFPIPETAGNTADLLDSRSAIHEELLRLLRMAAASDVPEEAGPVDGSATPLTCAIVAAARRDRTTAIVKTTRGDIEFELYRSDAPLTVSHFVTLARQGYYDGSPVSLVEPLSRVQTGIRFSNTKGRSRGPIRSEINMRPFERGSVGIVVSGKGTGGSRFFITLAPQPHLDGRNTCFGRVLSGMRVVESLTPGDRISRIMIEEEASIIDSRRF